MVGVGVAAALVSPVVAFGASAGLVDPKPDWKENAGAAGVVSGLEEEEEEAPKLNVPAGLEDVNPAVKLG